ncbi:MAG: ATP-binding domain-containing protein, partial [Ruminococcus sp.]|nr:ATP-binding domain-containing protein [Ruminococcus sp.]
EAQDFTNHWAEKVKELLAPDGSLYVFWDKNQDIFDRQKGNDLTADSIWNITTPKFILNTNLRNTKQIHNYIVSETEIGGDEIINMLDGIEVTGYEKMDAESAREEIETIIDWLINKEGISSSRIIIISNRSVKFGKSVFHDNQEIAGFTVYEPKDTGDFVHSDNVIEYRTIQKIKGCERDVVINISHPETDTDKYKALRYTALSRAKFMLYDFEITD